MAEWYFLEGDDPSNKQGPFTLDQLLDKVTDDCLVSNDDMLKSDSPWILLSDVLADGENEDENQGDGARSVFISTDSDKKSNEQKKQIMINIPVSTNGDHSESTETDKSNEQQQRLKEQQQRQQRQREEEEQRLQTQQRLQRQLEIQKIRKAQESKLKQQVLNIQSDETFDEEWFILSDDSTGNTSGPFTRWQIIKQVNEEQITGDTVTFLNGCKEFRYLKMCGEFKGLLPFIERDATIQSADHEAEDAIALTKGNLENKQWYFKDAYQEQCGPISLSEVFYKFSDGILGRNSQIRMEEEECWKTVEFIQKKFSKEWQQMVRQKGDAEMKNADEINAGDSSTNPANNVVANGPDNPNDANIGDVESDVDETEKELKYDPSFRALLDLDKQTQIEKKIKEKNPETVDNNEPNGNANGIDTVSEDLKKKRKRKRKSKRKRTETKRPNTSIYVTGLPVDITIYEIQDFFKKAGVIAKDIHNQGAPKIVIYPDKVGSALITYHLPHSVKLALDMLDETEIRNGYPVHIAAAKEEHFENAPKRKKQKVDGKRAATLKQMYGVESQLSWDDDARNRVPQLQWIVLQRMFTLEQLRSAPSMDMFVSELENDVAMECGKIGAVDKIDIVESNPKGVIRVKFRNPQHAAQCIEKMNRRYFDGRVIECHYWDGHTSYEIQETQEQQEERLRKFEEKIRKSNA